MRQLAGLRVQNSQVSQLAQRLTAVSLILFLGRRERAIHSRAELQKGSGLRQMSRGVLYIEFR